MGDIASYIALLMELHPQAQKLQELLKLRGVPMVDQDFQLVFKKSNLTPTLIRSQPSRSRSGSWSPRTDSLAVNMSIFILTVFFSSYIFLLSSSFNMFVAGFGGEFIKAFSKEKLPKDFFSTKAFLNKFCIVSLFSTQK